MELALQRYWFAGSLSKDSQLTHKFHNFGGDGLIFGGQILFQFSGLSVDDCWLQANRKETAWNQSIFVCLAL